MANLACVTLLCTPWYRHVNIPGVGSVSTTTGQPLGQNSEENSRKWEIAGLSSVKANEKHAQIT